MCEVGREIVLSSKYIKQITEEFKELCITWWVVFATDIFVINHIFPLYKLGKLDDNLYLIILQIVKWDLFRKQQ